MASLPDADAQGARPGPCSLARAGGLAAAGVRGPGNRRDRPIRRGARPTARLRRRSTRSWPGPWPPGRRGHWPRPLPSTAGCWPTSSSYGKTPSDAQPWKDDRPAHFRSRPSNRCGRSCTARIALANIATFTFEDLDLLPDRPSQARLQELRGAVQKWLTSGPGAPARALSVEETSTPTESRVFVRGNPNNPGELAPRQVPRRAGRCRAEAVSTRQRTSRAGAGHRQPRESADRTSFRQSGLDAPFR